MNSFPSRLGSLGLFVFLVTPFAGLGACNSDDATDAPSTSGLSGQGGTTGNAAGGASGTPGSTGGTAGRGPGGDAGSSGKASGACKVDADCPTTLFTTKPADCAEGFCQSGVCSYRTRDADGDGSRQNRCEVTSDGPYVVVLGKDCDDTNASINPTQWDGPAGDGNPDRCGDGVDQNCSGVEGDDILANGASCACVPGDVRDCAQTPAGAPIAFPGGSPAPGSICAFGSQTCVKDPLIGGNWGPCIGAVAPSLEVCNGTDDDCDGKTDEPEAADALEFAYDGDGDGFAAIDPATKKPFATLRGCIGTPPNVPPAECTAAYCGDQATADCCPIKGWRTFTRPGDCDDRAGAINPGALERCNLIDDNCDGATDDAGSIGERPYLYDGDGDGYADTKKSAVLGCKAPCGALDESTCAQVWRTDIPLTDCNDASASVFPGVAEDCKTAADDNCNGSISDGCDCVYDAQNPLANAQDCGTPDDCVYVEKGSTCQPNGKYSACPAAIPKEAYCPDEDGDQYCVQNDGRCGQFCEPGKPRFPAPTTFRLKSLCRTSTSGLTEDCNDTRSSVNPAATERCGDAVDQNCQNGNDEGFETIGTPCDVPPATGACAGGGTLQCSSPGSSTTSCKAPANVPALSQNQYFTSPAPNGSWDWSCDGNVDIRVSAPRTLLTGSCSTMDGYFAPATHVTALNDWSAGKLLLVDETTASTLSCATFKTALTCGSSSRFFAVSCDASGCKPPTCANTIGLLRCTWTSGTGGGCKDATLPADQGICAVKTTYIGCR